MGDFSQIAHHRHRVGPISILPGQFRQRTRGVALHDHVKQIQNTAPVGKAQHGAHLIGAGFPGPMRNRLIQQGNRIAHRAFGSAGDQRQCIVGDFDIFQRRHLAQIGDSVFGLHPPEVKPLATRQNRHRNFANLGGGKDEFHMLGRFFQRFKQGIEGIGGQHMHFVDDIDLIARTGGAVMHAFDNLADIANPGAAGSIHFHHINVAAFGDGNAGFAHTAGFYRRATFSIWPDAIHAFGDDPRGGGFADPAHTRHHKSMRNPVGFKRVFQRAYHRFLADKIGEGCRAVLTCQNLIRRFCVLAVAHLACLYSGVRPYLMARWKKGESSGGDIGRRWHFLSKP